MSALQPSLSFFLTFSNMRHMGNEKDTELHTSEYEILLFQLY